MAHPKISVIIPVLNEAATITTLVSQVIQAQAVEVIIVDGGSVDQTVEVAQSLCFEFPDRVQLLSSRCGRAAQMNGGAEMATGDILLFLHADTQLPEHFEDWIRQVLQPAHMIAGAFELKIAGSQRALRWIEQGVKWRSHYLQMPYGDQAIFLRAETFRQVGGFPELPIMEDFELVCRLKGMGKIATVPIAVKTSGRRWQQLGIGRATLINQIVILGYLLGVPAQTLANWYRGGCFRSGNPHHRTQQKH
ncbi:MAG: glycosyltransferase family 2 protein [Oscillatoriales cyanobacterium RM2_1_1]|nr:glycosyltransferase family 2 protein [Oscillatoriales cyanobacterium SM2_3_0]NJO44987.1 glycosyltransferase family 2 protein [Oscillatoriales cyanobacterium RM2_1_1]